MLESDGLKCFFLLSESTEVFSSVGQKSEAVDWTIVFNLFRLPLFLTCEQITAYY